VKKHVKKQTLLALILVSAFASGASAQNSCSGLFASPPTLLRRVQERVLPSRFVRPIPAAEQQAIVEDAAHAFRKLPLLERRAWMTLARQVGAEALDPYKTVFDLHEAAEKFHTSARNELSTLFRALAFPSAQARLKALDTWTRSETHALVLYRIMTLRGLSGFAKDLDFLRENNVFFSDTRKLSSGALVTYAFEKEGRGKEISMFYRPAEKSETEWFKESDDDRYKTLFSRKLRPKVFLPATVLAPTSLKPSFIGGFSFDGLGEKRSWEIAHKSYEISLHRTMAEIKEIAQLTRETHSIHVHAVFEMRKGDPQFEKFTTWFKVMNDALYLRGLEEGLHGDEFIGPVQLVRDHSEGSRTPFLFDVQRPEAVTYQTQKFFSAGLRATIYGEASSPEFVKLGLELRDTTRDLAQLESSMNRVSDSLVTRAWEKLRANDTTDYARIVTDDVNSVRLLRQAGVRPDIVGRLVSAEATVALPFLGLESRPLFNFKTGEYEAASPASVARAEDARRSYLEGLLGLQKELDDFAAKGETVEAVDLQLAIQQTLTEWARRAKPSERFSY
jgi:hypothetical protein